MSVLFLCILCEAHAVGVEATLLVRCSNSRRLERPLPLVFALAFALDPGGQCLSGCQEDCVCVIPKKRSFQSMLIYWFKSALQDLPAFGMCTLVFHTVCDTRRPGNLWLQHSHAAIWMLRTCLSLFFFCVPSFLTPACGKTISTACMW